MEAVLIPPKQENFHLSRDTLESLPYQDKIIKIKEDTLGALFEKLIRKQEKKDSGQFYTPQEIVNYMVNFLDIKSNSKILDPTCGCGVFFSGRLQLSKTKKS